MVLEITFAASQKDSIRDKPPLLRFVLTRVANWEANRRSRLVYDSAKRV